MITLTRRRWLFHVAAVSCFASQARAETPPVEPRIAAATLPVTSRSTYLDREREIRPVVTAIAADPRGELLAAAGDDHVIRILQSSTLTTLHTLTGHRDLIRTLAFDDRGDRLVSAGNDGQLIVWDREEKFKVQKKYGGEVALACACFAPRSTEIAAVGFHDKIFVLGRERAERPNFTCDCRDLRAVAYREDLRILAVGGRSGMLHLFDAASGELLAQRKLHQGRIHDLAFQPGTNRLVSVGDDGRTVVFDSERMELIHEIPVSTCKLFAVAAINSELFTVAGSDNLIRVVAVDDGRLVRTLDGHHGSISALDSAGGWLFSGSYDTTLRRWAVSDIAESAQRIAEVDPRIDR
jgi:WD40 repeat protein